ncbi:2-phospho-L-lactate transferase [Demequina sp. SYSU T00039]|uniref:2-phospho-L-lactate transferase n=1 Tax=Demequina lignilytica TaxID=3051663 RepID=A0AAW7M2R3_9MICO|nr:MULTISPECIES: 2-phospho-L-lactate transferase [unclassified Demequina]MDN4479192.1 2-phospho-L-lactate transferase [Demequina sp. SYSU T00039-1]MDN4487949.1 2-phospho-L-lactate transferase [Demequina sp. SYSU T00039]MDN4491755.1 2-phospho-L-lactate transferase [Demequina sp. SYSU T00068]
MTDPLRIVALSGGVGGARFLRGLVAWGATAGVPLDVTVIANTGDDMRLHGLQICPDLDTVMYTLGGVISEAQGWGREDERFTVAEELRPYGVGWEWFTLGDRDIATHLARTSLLDAGQPLSAATARLAARWDLPVTLLPMSDQPVETHVELSGGEVMHFEEWWVRTRAAAPARRFVQVRVDEAAPAPGVLDAIAGADLVLLPPSNPVVSVGTILGVPGIADALRSAAAPLVGVSPIIGGAAVRGMAEACLATLGVPATAAGVALDYRSRHGLLDGWLVDDADAGALDELASAGVAGLARPLWMTDVDTTAAIAAAAVELGLSLR